MGTAACGGRVQGKGSGKWQEANRRRPPQTATQPGIMPIPPPAPTQNGPKGWGPCHAPVGPRGGVPQWGMATGRDGHGRRPGLRQRVQGMGMGLRHRMPAQEPSSEGLGSEGCM